MSGAERRRPILPIRILLTVVLAGAVLYVAGALVWIGWWQHRKVAGAATGLETIREEMDLLVREGDEVLELILFVEGEVDQQPGLIPEALQRIRRQEESSASIRRASQRPELTPTLRQLLADAAEVEASLLVRLRETAAAIQLGEGDRVRERMDLAWLQQDLLDGLLHRAQLEAFIDLAERQLLLERAASGATRFLVLWLLVGLFALLFVVWVIRRRVFRPLERLRYGLEQVAEGQLDTRIAVQSRDEIGQLTDHFNSMTEILRARSQEEAEIRQRVQAELRRSEAYLETFTERSSDMVVVLEGTGTVRFCSPAVEEMLGVPRESVEGAPVTSLVAEEDRTLVERILTRARRSAGGEEILLRVRSAGGTRGGRTLEIRAINALEDPAVEALIAVARDVTEVEEREAEQRQSQRMEAVGQLTVGIAHDFNNLLTVVRGNLEMALADIEDTTTVDQMLRQAVSASERGADLTRHLLAFSRRQDLHPTEVDLRVIGARVIRLLSRKSPDSVQLVLDGSPDLWPCELDPGQIETALVNLTLNALDAMPGGGRATFRFRNRPATGDMPVPDRLMGVDCVVATIQDTGEGMSPELRERAFEPFFTTKEVGRGSGLGLSMVYGFVKQSGGEIELSSKLGEGTSVSLIFPRAGVRRPGAREHGSPVRFIGPGPQSSHVGGRG